MRSTVVIHSQTCDTSGRRKRIEREDGEVRAAGRRGRGVPEESARTAVEDREDVANRCIYLTPPC